jgi:hypothetical protein
MSPANRAKLGAYLMVGIVALMLFITGTQRSQGSGRLASADGISSRRSTSFRVLNLWVFAAHSVSCAWFDSRQLQKEYAVS